MPRTRKNKWPLRKVVNRYMEENVTGSGARWGRFVEKLECGHVVRVRQDIYGQTVAGRRRCRECAS